jgi:MoaA/NifB/PqqE/SkfB family radical SAM enzyme
MSTLQVQIDRSLARTVAWTDRLKRHGDHPRWASVRRALHGLDFCARGLFHVWRNRRYFTLLKLANMALVNLQFALKTQYVVGRPYNMKIESTNICNTKCQLCPTGIGLEGRPKGKMSLDHFQKLIHSLRWHLFGLDLSMWGDPLIVPDIFAMIRFAHERGIWTYISSNLHAFKITPKPGEKSQAQRLVESGLDTLTCSLHGASQETFAIYQPGKSFADTLDKVKHILATRNAMGSPTPAVQLNFVVTRHNEHEREKFQKLADELGCKAVFSTASMNIRFLNQDKQLHNLGLAPDLLDKKTQAHLQHWLPTDQEFVLEPYRRILQGHNPRGEEYNGHKPFNCSWPWRSSVINWDGQVVTCCGNFDPKEDMGCVFEQPFATIWNGRKYRAARKSFKHQVTAAESQDNACASCPGYML